MSDPTSKSATSSALPRFAAGGAPSSRRRPWWLWTPVVLIVVIVATVAVLMVSRGPDAILAQGQPAAEAPPKTVQPMSDRIPVAPTNPAPVTSLPVAPVAGMPGQPTSTLTPATGSVPPTTQPAGTDATNDLTPQLRHGLALIADGKLIEGRAVLSDLYTTLYHELTREDAQAIRDTLASVNHDIVFGPKITPGDTITELYQVQPGDVLTRVTLKYKIPYQLVERINNVQANRIRAGQSLKMVKGPLHAIVHKGEFRMDVFAHGPDSKPVYIRSFPVGLGELDSTPQGSWVLNGKVSNPGWTNPRDNRTYTPDDPANPIGEYWIGLRGTSESTQDKRGYGIHGTIEPESIGRMMSMGCIRLRNDDIAMVYQMLYDKLSSVTVEP